MYFVRRMWKGYFRDKSFFPAVLTRSTFLCALCLRRACPLWPCLEPSFCGGPCLRQRDWSYTCLLPADCSISRKAPVCFSSSAGLISIIYRGAFKLLLSVANYQKSLKMKCMLRGLPCPCVVVVVHVLCQCIKHVWLCCISIIYYYFSAVHDWWWCL